MQLPTYLILVGLGGRDAVAVLLPSDCGLWPPLCHAAHFKVLLAGLPLDGIEPRRAYI